MNQTRELSENRYVVTYKVGPTESGLRLDSFLKTKYPKRSRSRIQRDILSGAILMTREIDSYQPLGSDLKSSSQILEGDQIQICSERKLEPPVNFNFKILHEDDDFFIIDKPANLPVHPAGRYFFHSLLVYLKTTYNRSLQKPNEYYLIHRIDRETSGILILAKKKHLCEPMLQLFKNRKIKKTYLAWSHHSPDDDTAIPLKVNLPIGSAKYSRIRLKMGPRDVSDGGQVAETHFIPLETFTDQEQNQYTLWECHPKTGRQHQIRVHLDEAGFPLVGDKLYGRDEKEILHFFDSNNIKSKNDGTDSDSYFIDVPKKLKADLILDRHALHAYKIEFDHPLTGKPYRIESTHPDDIHAWEKTLNKQTQTS